MYLFHTQLFSTSRRLQNKLIKINKNLKTVVVLKIIFITFNVLDNVSMIMISKKTNDWLHNVYTLPYSRFKSMLYINDNL